MNPNSENNKLYENAEEQEYILRNLISLLYNENPPQNTFSSITPENLNLNSSYNNNNNNNNHSEYNNDNNNNNFCVDLGALVPDITYSYGNPITSEYNDNNVTSSLAHTIFPESKNNNDNSINNNNNNNNNALYTTSYLPPYDLSQEQDQTKSTKGDVLPSTLTSYIPEDITSPSGPQGSFLPTSTSTSTSSFGTSYSFEPPQQIDNNSDTSYNRSSSNSSVAPSSSSISCSTNKNSSQKTHKGENKILLLTSDIKTPTIVAGSDVCATIPLNVVEIDQHRLENELGISWTDQMKVTCSLAGRNDDNEVRGTIITSQENIGEGQSILRRTAFFNNIQIFEASNNVQLQFMLKYNDSIIDRVFSSKFSTITNKGKSQQLKRKRNALGEDLENITPSRGPKQGGQKAKIKGIFLPLSHTVNNFDVFFSTSQARVIEVTPDCLTVEVPKLPSIIDAGKHQDVTVEVTVVNKSPRLPSKKRRRLEPSPLVASCETVHLKGNIKYTYEGEPYDTEQSTITETQDSNQQSQNQDNFYEYFQSGNTDPSNNTLLHLSTSYGLGNLSTDIALNHQYCFLVNQCNNFDVTPFMLAMGSGDSTFIQTCVDSFNDQLDLAQINKSGENVFHYGALADNLVGLRTLLENLHKLPIEDTAQLLQETICDQKDIDGNTPFDIASPLVKSLFNQHLSVYGLSCGEHQLLPTELESKRVNIQGVETDLSAPNCKISLSCDCIQFTFGHDNKMFTVKTDLNNIDSVHIDRGSTKTQILLDPTPLKVCSPDDSSSYQPIESNELGGIKEVWEVETFWEPDCLEGFIEALRQLPQDVNWFSAVVKE